MKVKALSDETPFDTLTEKDERLRLGRERREAASSQIELFHGLPSPRREYVLNGEQLGAKGRPAWSFERLERHYDRLATFASMHDDTRISESLEKARRFKCRIGRIPLRDLIQEGYLGLLKAVDRFDPDRGSTFSTYANWWIRRALNDAFTYRARLIRLPESVRRDLRHLRLASADLETSLGREPRENELAARLQMTTKRVKRLLSVVKEPSALEDLGGSRDHRWEGFIEETGATGSASSDPDGRGCPRGSFIV